MASICDLATFLHFFIFSSLTLIDTVNHLLTRSCQKQKDNGLLKQKKPIKRAHYRWIWKIFTFSWFIHLLHSPHLQNQLKRWTSYLLMNDGWEGREQCQKYSSESIWLIRSIVKLKPDLRHSWVLLIFHSETYW